MDNAYVYLTTALFRDKSTAGSKIVVDTSNAHRYFNEIPCTSNNRVTPILNLDGNVAGDVSTVNYALIKWPDEAVARRYFVTEKNVTEDSVIALTCREDFLATFSDLITNSVGYVTMASMPAVVDDAIPVQAVNVDTYPEDEIKEQLVLNNACFYSASTSVDHDTFIALLTTPICLVDPDDNKADAEGYSGQLFTYTFKPTELINLLSSLTTATAAPDITGGLFSGAEQFLQSIVSVKLLPINPAGLSLESLKQPGFGGTVVTNKLKRFGLDLSVTRTSYPITVSNTVLTDTTYPFTRERLWQSAFHPLVFGTTVTLYNNFADHTKHEYSTNISSALNKSPYTTVEIEYGPFGIFNIAPEEMTGTDLLGSIIVDVTGNISELYVYTNPNNEPHWMPKAGDTILAKATGNILIDFPVNAASYSSNQTSLSIANIPMVMTAGPAATGLSITSGILATKMHNAPIGSMSAVLPFSDTKFKAYIYNKNPLNIDSYDYANLAVDYPVNNTYTLGDWDLHHIKVSDIIAYGATQIAPSMTEKAELLNLLANGIWLESTGEPPVLPVAPPVMPEGYGLLTLYGDIGAYIKTDTLKRQWVTKLNFKNNTENLVNAVLVPLGSVVGVRGYLKYVYNVNYYSYRVNISEDGATWSFNQDTQNVDAEFMMTHKHAVVSVSRTSALPDTPPVNYVPTAEDATVTLYPGLVPAATQPDGYTQICNEYGGSNSYNNIPYEAMSQLNLAECAVTFIVKRGEIKAFGNYYTETPTPTSTQFINGDLFNAKHPITVEGPTTVSPNYGNSITRTITLPDGVVITEVTTDTNKVNLTTEGVYEFTAPSLFLDRLTFRSSNKILVNGVQATEFTLTDNVVITKYVSA